MGKDSLYLRQMQSEQTIKQMSANSFLCFLTTVLYICTFVLSYFGKYKLKEWMIWNVHTKLPSVAFCHTFCDRIL